MSTSITSVTTTTIQEYIIRPFAVFIKIILVFFMLFSISAVYAQNSKKTKVPINSRNNGSKNNPRGFIEYLPKNYNSRNNWPVIIWHHGLGSDGNGSSSALNKLLNQHIMGYVNSNDIPFIVLSPQGSNGYFGGGRMEAFYDWVRKEYQNKSDPDAYHIEVLSASGTGLTKMLEANGLMSKQVATLTINGALTGVGKASIYQSVAQNNTKVWFHHGDKDNTVKPGAPTNFYRGLLNEIGGEDYDRFRFTLYTNMGHSAWNEVYDNSGRNRGKNTGKISGGNYGNYYNWTTESWYDWLLNNSKSGGQAPPSVNAGSDISLNLPVNSTNLNGSGNSVKGSITNYLWAKKSGPGAFTLTNQNQANATITDLVEGIYIFELTVTDNLGQTATDEVKVTVVDANESPLVSAGADVTITLPVNSVTISATASDADGSISTRQWTKNSGPAATLAGTNTSTLLASDLVEGAYRFRFRATDNDGASAFDDVRVTVNAAAVNQNPVANAGPDRTIDLPTNSIVITGGGSDADGSINAYQWAKVSGPAATLVNTNSSALTANNLVAGNYVFRLTVTDNNGATDDDEVTITVSAANQNPAANAGPDVEISLPTSSVTITGLASDNDGTIANYLWSQTAGPNAATLVNSNSTSLTASDLIEGSYTFLLTASDNDGAQGSDEMKVLVNAEAVNEAPTANAGTDQTITLPTNSVQLNGSGSDTDGTITTYQWFKINGPGSFNISDNNIADPVISNLTEGSYTFRLRVGDDGGKTGVDQVKINVLPEVVNQSPDADAGADKTLTLPDNSTDLTGTASDPDGSITSTQWSQLSGPSGITLSGESSLVLSLSDLVSGNYRFRLEITDNDGATDTDDVNVTVNNANQPPSAFAGNDVVLNLPTNSISITGTANDADGTIASTNWTQQDGDVPTITIVGNQLNLADLTEGIYIFRFEVTDNDGASASDEIKITVNGTNSKPVVNAGPNRSITLPTNSINISGASSDADGSVASVIWTKVSGPTATLTNANNNTLTASGLVEGVYIFRLSATDNDGATAFDDMQLEVKAAFVNQPPLADAGENIEIFLPVSSVTLNGLGSDPDGAIDSYQWSKVSGPAATLANATTPTLSVSGLIEGTYNFRLTVVDDAGANATDVAQVIVYPEATNQNPVANAGTNKTIVLPTNNINLNGSAVDNDGDIVRYLWSQTQGPNSAILSNANAATLIVTAMVEGEYLFELEVEDDDGAIDADIVRVIVLPSNANVEPVADAGPDIDIYLPTNNINIIGSGSDDDGTIDSYAWTKTSGPSATLTNINTPILSASNLVEGLYRFRLRVTDDDGAIAESSMKLRVLPEEANSLPSVNAGEDKTLILPDSIANFFGIASDTDGSIVTYLWEQISGNAAILTDENTINLIVSGLEEGVYRFRLTVTDNDGASNSDEIKLSVLPSTANNLPVANAGNDFTVKLPENTAIINGSATDADGDIVSYAWDKLSGPAATLLNEDTPNLTLEDLQAGRYEFILEVEDNDGGLDTDEIVLTVLPASANLNPEVDAGDDIDIPINELPFTINASASDSDGTIDSFVWTQVSGDPVNLSDENTLNLTIESGAEGFYEFSISVTDDRGAVASDLIAVNILPDDSRPAPVINAGQDTTIILPNNSIVLDVEVISQNLINSYQWMQLGGPAVTLLPADTSAIELAGLVKGTYEFEITVTDVDSLQGSDILLVFVKDEVLENDFPKIFTPNGDGQNDFWLVDDLERIENCSLSIYDTTGRIVYQSSNYQNDWSGTSNGVALNAGAYYYIFDCSDGANIRGGVRIVR